VRLLTTVTDAVATDESIATSTTTCRSAADRAPHVGVCRAAAAPLPYGTDYCRLRYLAGYGGGCGVV